MAQLGSVRLPSKAIKRGRPKGHEKTIIGLPTKRQKKNILPFVKKPPLDKDKGQYSFCYAI